MSVPASITTFPGIKPVAARATAVYRAKIVDQNGTAIPGTSLLSVTLTLVDIESGAIVNGVSAVNILNTNRGAIDGAGNLVVTLQPADTAIVGDLLSAGRVQNRSMVIDWTYNGGSSTGRHQINFPIVALAEP